MPQSSISNRPALICFLACGAGIAIARICHAGTRPEILLAISLFALSIICAFFVRSKFKAVSQLLGIGSLVLLGFLLFCSQEYFFENSAVNKVASIRSGEAIIYGKVTGHPEISSSSVSFFLLTDSLIVDFLIVSSREKIYVSVSGVQNADTQYIPKFGQRVKLYAELAQIEGARNPYEFSSDIRLKEKEGIRARAYLRSPFDIYITDSKAELSVLERSEEFFRSLYDESRGLIGNAISDSLTKGFVSAIVLGDKTGLSQETLDDFQKAGLTHLLVVSGFNVSIVALIIYYFLRLIGLRFRRLRIMLSMCAVLFYCLVVGLEPSVVRALIVSEFVFLSYLIERKPDIGNLTAAAALMTIIFHPYDLFDIGFQLSYGAVFSLVFFHPAFEKLFIPGALIASKTPFYKIVHRTVQGFLGSLSIFLGLLPVFLYHFHRVSIVGLAINILGIPLAAIITIFGFLLLPLSLLSNWLASVYGEALLWMTKLVTFIAHLSGSFKWSVIQLPRPQTALILLYIVSLFYILRAKVRMNFFGRSLLVFSFALILFFAKIPFAYSLVKSPDTASLLFFDVGQGDAMLLTAPNGKSYVIDCGGITQSYSPIAERTILPFFKAEGIDQLGGDFITHMHIDHYGGAVLMIENTHCEAIYTSGERTTGYAAYRLDSICQAQHIPVLSIHQGQRIDLSKDLHIFVLNPSPITSEVMLPLSFEGMNHHSLALKVVYKESSALLLGDIEASDEEALVKRYGDFLRSDIVKVAHHGSQTSSSQEFVKASKPQFAVISVGKHNTFGHPNPVVVKRWIKSGATVLQTDKEGALLFQSNGYTFRKTEWK